MGAIQKKMLKRIRGKQKNRTRRKMAHETYLVYVAGEIRIEVYNHTIFRLFMNDDFSFNAGNYVDENGNKVKTNIVKDRLNTLALNELGYHVFQKKGVWYVKYPDETIVEFDIVENKIHHTGTENIVPSCVNLNHIDNKSPFENVDNNPFWYNANRISEKFNLTVEDANNIIERIKKKFNTYDDVNENRARGIVTYYIGSHYGENALRERGL